jgi:2-polyprenyl-6-methoxyphenol hydroxylase-like FAD-dependent oxidoreductase
MRVLISGAGIAGPTLAYWLFHYGFEPTLVEKASSWRTGGYIIDFWGAGYEIANRMGLLSEITSKGYRVQEVKVVNRNGRRVAGFPADAFPRATEGKYTSLPRGDLAASIFRKIEGQDREEWEWIGMELSHRPRCHPESVPVRFDSALRTVRGR